MRITGGELRGRRLRAPAGNHVRPTQDRVREALFGMLAPMIRGARCVDLYAGTGALGLEALSRGALRVIWVERNRRTLEVLRDNVAMLAGPGRETVGDDVLRWLRRGDCPEAVDIFFADPPYAVNRGDVVRDLLEAVRLAGCLSSRGLVVVEQSSREPAREVDQWSIWRDRVYGAARLAIYRRAAVRE